MEQQIKFYRASKSSFFPERGSLCSAGYDLRASEDAVIYPIPTVNNPVPTGIIVIIPEGCYGRIAPRSGLSLKLIDIGAGVIDRDYRGKISIIMFNYGDIPFKIKKGDKVAQFICEKINESDMIEISKDEFENEEKTKRGTSGFGSTGI